MFIVVYPELDQRPFFAKNAQEVRDVLEEENSGHYRGTYSAGEGIQLDWVDNVNVRFSVIMYRLSDEEIKMIKGLK